RAIADAGARGANEARPVGRSGDPADWRANRKVGASLRMAAADGEAADAGERGSVTAGPRLDAIAVGHAHSVSSPSNSVVPIRTIVAPSSTATSKSPDMPMERWSS